jgi:hypothetical protein
MCLTLRRLGRRRAGQYASARGSVAGRFLPEALACARFAALHVPHNRQPGLVLRDVIISGKARFACRRRRKEDATMMSVRVVMTTAGHQPVERRYGLEAGLHDVVPNPDDDPLRRTTNPASAGAGRRRLQRCGSACEGNGKGGDHGEGDRGSAAGAFTGFCRTKAKPAVNPACGRVCPSSRRCYRPRFTFGRIRKSGTFRVRNNNTAHAIGCNAPTAKPDGLFRL